MTKHSIQQSWAQSMFFNVMQFQDN